MWFCRCFWHIVGLGVGRRPAPYPGVVSAFSNFYVAGTSKSVIFSRDILCHCNIKYKSLQHISWHQKKITVTSIVKKNVPPSLAKDVAHRIHCVRYIVVFACFFDLIFSPWCRYLVAVIGPLQGTKPHGTREYHSQPCKILCLPKPKILWRLPQTRGVLFFLDILANTIYRQAIQVCEPIK